MLLITSWREREEPGCLRLNRLGRIQASTPFPIRTSGTHAQTPFTCTATHRDFPLRQPAAPRHGADGSLVWLELCGWNYLWLDPCFYREPLGIASFFLSTTAFFLQTPNREPTCLDQQGWSALYLWSSVALSVDTDFVSFGGSLPCPHVPCPVLNVLFYEYKEWSISHPFSLLSLAIVLNKTPHLHLIKAVISRQTFL